MTPRSFVLLLGGDGRDELDRHHDDAVDVVAAVDAGPNAVVVAADSGLERADRLGLVAAHVVGDLDSVDPTVLARAEAAGATVHRHPADKDATDGELAVALIAGMATDVPVGTPLLVVGSAAGRIDLLIADLLLLAGPRTADLAVTARFGPATATILRPDRPTVIRGAVGEQVSILPLHGPADGVHTSGLRWPLVDARLGPGTTRGVSNELVAERATVTISGGVAVVIQQGIVAPAPADRVGGYDPSPT